MIVIGITGGIGAGKSKAARYIAEKGYVIIDADQIGRNMTADGEPVLEKLNMMFGPDGEFGDLDVEIVSPSASVNGGLHLNREAMADLVFNNESRKKAFDALMHKEIIAEIDRKIEAIKKGEDTACAANRDHIKGILLDIPLLFETGMQNRCDVVILVTADEHVRIARIMERDGMSEVQIKARIRNQMDDSAKAKLADYVIDNSGDYEYLKDGLDGIFKQIE